MSLSHYRDTAVSAVIEHIAEMRLRGLSEASIRQRRYALRRLARATGRDPLHLSEDDLDRWQRTLALTARGRAFEMTQVAQFYRWAHRRGLIPTDPSVVLIRPKRPRSLPRPIGEDDLRVAIAAAPRDIRLMLVLAAFAGARAAELAGLNREDILDTAIDPVVVWHGKGGKDRVVPLGPHVLDELHVYGLPSRGPVFRRRDGQPGNNDPARISHLCNRYLHDLGIAVTLHCLRHRFGTRMYAVSHDLRMVQEVMGHNDPATTSGYVAYSAESAKRAVTALENPDVPWYTY